MHWTTALVSCTFLGFQHGLDWDHVAAISDLTSVQNSAGESRRCGMLYAIGHAATVGTLGLALIALHQSLPADIVIWMQRLVEITLIGLGVYVVTALVSGGVVASRGQAIRTLFSRGHSHEWTDQRCGPRSSLSLGVLHGIGAETPTQLSMLLIASNLGGFGSGALALLVFATAMFVSNMGLTAVATSVFTASKVRPALFRALSVLNAAYSLWIGVVLIRS